MASKNMKAVAVAVDLMLCASVSYAQQPFSQSSNPGSYVGFAQTPSALQSMYPRDQIGVRTGPDTRPSSSYVPSYVACWAEVPAHNTAYFSATFELPGVKDFRKQFRTFVTTHYGRVSKVQCTAALVRAAVTEQVEKWKDSARTAKNAIADT